jgi:hypothetical protein
MNATQALKLLTAGALAVFAVKAATQLMGGRGGIVTEMVAAGAGVYLAQRLS